MVQLSPASLDVAAIRADFPLLTREFDGRKLVYLDSAATSQKPQSVIDAMVEYYTHHNANVHRGVYRLAEEATAMYEAARATVAEFVGAAPEETIFVRNASEAINLVAHTWAQANLRAGDAIVLTPLEHHSNLVPWQILAARTGARLRFMDLNEDGSLDLSSLDRHLADGRVRLVSVAYVSNVLGTIAPADDIVRASHAAGAAVLFDAAQAVPHLPIDVHALDADFVAFTGHKMLGPMGIGVLYGRREILEAMPPFLGGGEMIRRVDLEGATWNDLPWKFEAGTPSVGDAVGLAEAVRYLQRIGMEAVEMHDRSLTGYAVERLRDVPGVRVHGPTIRGAVAAFSVEGIHPHDLASLLDERAIAVRAGHHCAQPLHDTLGLAATTRASFYLYNDESEVDALIEGIVHAQRVFLA
jgi:cysteine desulfurase/selenocysteine lyase